MEFSSPEASRILTPAARIVSTISGLISTAQTSSPARAKYPANKAPKAPVPMTAIFIFHL
jgi:hypothetical protein